MITIIPPADFKTVPWKNGKGVTIELAISEGGTLDDFNWRISIATVASDGEFSNFSGLTRNLVLIEGNGLRLDHEAPDGSKAKDTLNHLLDMAHFDGGAKTFGTLTKGPIKDFNIMVKTDKYRLVTDTYQTELTADIPDSDLCFVYGLQGDIILKGAEGKTKAILEQGHLLRLDSPTNDLTVTGKMMIVVGVKSPN